MHDNDAAATIRFRGRPLRLRELRASDRSRIEALLARVAPPDLQLRFFGAFRRVPPQLLDQLSRIHPKDRLTVAAVLENDGSDSDVEILGVARAHRIADEAAEAALLVRSDLNGGGLGTILLGKLIAGCRDWGISRMCAEVMRRNSRMQRLVGEVTLSLRGRAGRYLSSRPRSQLTTLSEGRTPAMRLALAARVSIMFSG